jgi:hypothetical protein
MNFAYEAFIFMLVEFFNMLQNFTTWNQRLYFPSEESRASEFDCPQKSIVLGRVYALEPRGNGKHGNHYTTEGDLS